MTVSVPKEAITQGPSVSWRHIDGPMLSWAGQVHWLTLRERFSIWMRLTTVDAVAAKRWPHLAKARLRLTVEERLGRYRR